MQILNSIPKVNFHDYDHHLIGSFHFMVIIIINIFLSHIIMFNTGTKYKRISEARHLASIQNNKAAMQENLWSSLFVVMYRSGSKNKPTYYQIPNAISHGSHVILW